MISIIIPVHNSEKYLRYCLDSVAGQTFRDFECICVIDSEGDNSLEILKEYASKDFRFIIIKKTAGTINDNRNAGLENAKGEYVYFLDSDDYISPDYIEGFYKVAAETNASVVINPNITLLYTNVRKQMPQNLYKEKEYFVTPQNISEVLKNVYLWNKLFKSELLKKINVKFPDIIISEDLYFCWCVMPFAGKIAVNYEGQYFYRQSSSQVSRGLTGKTPEFFINAYNLVKDFYRENKLEDNWQVPVYCLYYQLRYNFNAKTFLSDYEKIKVAIDDTVMHNALLSKPEKIFIKRVNKGILYCFLTVCVKIVVIKLIKSVARPFLLR